MKNKEFPKNQKKISDKYFHILTSIMISIFQLKTQSNYLTVQITKPTQWRLTIKDLFDLSTIGRLDNFFIRLTERQTALKESTSFPAELLDRQSVHHFVQGLEFDFSEHKDYYLHKIEIFAIRDNECEFEWGVSDSTELELVKQDYAKNHYRTIISENFTHLLEAAKAKT